MNFLSHYYLDRIKNNHYYNAGLTLPDLLGFHKGRIRLTEKTILQLQNLNMNNDLLNGMRAHLKLDKKFHTSDFFKKNTLLLQSMFEANTQHNLSHFNCHIILEMLIDKFILHRNPEIAKEFYEVYSHIDFNVITSTFISLNDFNKQNMFDLLTRFSQSSYIGEYINISAIINISNIVSKKFNKGNNQLDRDNTKVFQDFYNQIENEISILLAENKSAEI
ncbi:MAG: hypothetical protein A2015_11575 [Spirochaetes bacterium GWF1_31_7]|nr:MAG: hypothetical protein A2Y30_15500 [Spirochaetes bacterium GWE1_32_154]OHD49062.1 MAG: hypothetical protein A2015_11575 [Spirochaetes bacterium GWF1_31_7]OHD50354.1 MAG: hypothetical protein A2Y29_13550 [Spirochaetes bacterium GWE2_31_10]OHD79977.1 MAG: hypothetical protein A2355_15785 [Spirochaetes bacterium RIFOXYB1_FULL_32_8]HBD93858.1 hypothetical protein [Spirochaetia bacterium]